MSTITRLFGAYTKRRKEQEKNTQQRYCSVYESLDESLKELKLIKERKINPKTWDELYKELKHNKGS